VDYITPEQREEIKTLAIAIAVDFDELDNVI